MGKTYDVILPPPVRGVNRRLSKERQPVGTTHDMVNIVPVDKRDGRIRCGSRPGLVKHYESFFGVPSDPWGTVSSVVFGGVTTVLTATTAVFSSGDAGSTLTFVSSGNSYPIASFTSTTKVNLTGNASAESGEFRVSVGYYTGDKINLLSVIRHAASETKRYFARSVLELPAKEHITLIPQATSPVFAPIFESAIKDGTDYKSLAQSGFTGGITGVIANFPYRFIADVDYGVTYGYGHSPYHYEGAAYVSRKSSTTSNYVRFEGTTTLPAISDLSTGASYSVTTNFALKWWEKDSDPNVEVAHNQTFLVAVKMSDTSPDIITNGMLIATNIKRTERKVELRADSGANDTDLITIRAYRIVAGVATVIKGRVLVASKGYWNVKQVVPIKVTVAASGAVSMQFDGIDVDWYVSGAWNNATVASTGLTGSRMGIGCVYKTLAGSQNIPSTSKLARYKRLPAFTLYNIAYTSTNTIATSKIKESTIIGAGGRVYSDLTTTGVIAQNGQNYNVNSDEAIMSTEALSNLYVADFGAPISSGSLTVTGISNNTITYTGPSDLSAVTGIDAYNYGIQLTATITGFSSGFYAITAFGGSAPNYTMDISPRPGNLVAGSYTIPYKIVRYPKKVDTTVAESTSWSPFVATASLTAAAYGTVPYNCNIIARYRGRIVMAGNPEFPNLWYMSRTDDATDWSFSGDTEDLARAISGNDAEAGQVGSPITAIAPFRDDTCIFFGIGETYIMANDPAYGGQLQKVSGSAGCIGRFAWCYGPGSEVYFMSLNGLYVMSAVGSEPVAISDSIVPIDLQSINTSESGNEVYLAYDNLYKGIRINIVPKNGNNGNHWWYDLSTGGFFPIRYAVAEHQPNVIARIIKDRVEDRVVYGCLDGYLRYHSRNATDDDGYQFESFIEYNTRVPKMNINADGMLESLVVAIGAGSSPIDWQITGGKSTEDVTRSARRPQISGTIYPPTEVTSEGETNALGCSRTIRPKIRGGSFVIRLKGADDLRGTLSTAVHAAGSTTLTATTSLFRAGDVGRNVTFTATNNAYAIASVTSGTVAVLTGNASAETGLFYIGDGDFDGSFVVDELAATVTELGRQRL